MLLRRGWKHALILWKVFKDLNVKIFFFLS